MSDEQEDYTRSFVTRSDIDKEAAWETNKKKIEKPGYVYIRHTSDEYVSGIRNASDGVAWGASQLNLKDLKGAVGTGADYDDTDIQRELAAQAKRIEANEDNISDLDKNKADEGHTHDDLVTGEHTHDAYQPKGDYATKSELTSGLAGKSDDPHTHDYAADDHDHDLVYQPKGDYATDDHGHDDYETKKDADIVHEALTESLAGKADDDHDHAGVYAPFDHGHENLATDDHTHDEYQPKGNYADSVHIHTEYAETGDLEELTAAINEEAKDRAHADGLLQDQVTANKESIDALSEKGYDDSWIQPALDGKSDTTHTHDDLATGDHTHDEYLISSDLPDPYDDTQIKEDIKANADAIAEIQSNGYDDTQIREDFAAADADTLSSANDYTDEKIGAIPEPVPYDDTQVKEDIQTNAQAIQANKESIEALGEKGYDDTGVKRDIQTNADNIAANTKAIEEIVVPDVSDFVTSEELSTGLSGKSDTTHTHDAPDLTHDHSGVYAEEDHTHDEYLTDLTHDHEGVYQPVGDYALDTHTHDTTHDHDGTYQPAGDYATNDALTTGLSGKSDTTHTHAPQDLTHDHDGTYQPAGDYATKGELTSGLAGKEDVGHTHDTTHDHDEYAKVEELELIKGEIIDIEAELEAIAPNREKGDWEATDGGAPRPGQANLANPSFTAPQNILVINQVDANQETHTFNEVEEGDNIEIAVDENNLGLYEVGPSTRSDVVSLNLILIKGQGSIKAGDQIKINIFGLADQNLDLEELDGRYLQLTGGDLSSGGAYIGTNRLKPQGSGTNTLYEGSSYSHPQALINSAMMKEYAAEKEHEHDIPSAVHVGEDPPEKPSEGDLWFLATEDEDKPDKLFIWANDTWEPTTSLQHERQMRIAEDLLITQSLHRADSHYMYRLDKIVLPEPLFADKGVVVHDGELPDQITDDKIHFRKDYSTGDYLGFGQEFAFRGDDPGDGIRYAIMHHADPPITYREEWFVKSVTYANGTVTVRAQFAFGDHWGSYERFPCSLWLLTEDDISDVPYLPTTGGTLNGNLNFSGEENYITENGNNRLRFNGKVIVNRGDSTNADGFEIKGKTSNGNNDKLLGVYHNANGLDAINYYGKQDGNENLATVKYVKDRVNGHDHNDNYIRKDADTNLPHTPDYKWTTIHSRTPKDENGNSDTSTPFGLAIDLDEGGTYKNQFEVGTKRNGYALKVLGGGGREVWIGGSISQKDGDLENPNDENYITRKNLNEHTHEGYMLTGEWPEEDWPTGPMTGYEFWDFIDKMFALNDFNQKLQDAEIKKKADLNEQNTYTEMQTSNVKEGNAFWTMKLNGGTICTIWTDGQYTGKYVAEPKQTAMITRKWFEEREAILLQKINALEERVDRLEKGKSPDAEITLTLRSDGSRPTGSSQNAGIISVWKLAEGSTTNPPNEFKAHMGSTGIADSEWAEVWFVQGDKTQKWKSNGSWVTNTNVLHVSAASYFGDTLVADQEVKVLFFL